MCTICESVRLQTDDCVYSDEDLQADIHETVDATSTWNFGPTNYELTPGDTFFGHLWVGDVDVFSIDLSAGVDYSVLLDAHPTQSNDVDDTILLLVDETGTVLRLEDDIDAASGNRYSQLDFSVDTSGTYKLVATTFNTYYNTGSTLDYGYYQLSVTEAASETMRAYTLDEIANQLSYSGWGDVSYRWNVSPGDTIRVDISGLTSAGQTLALSAMEAWTNVTGINFSTSGSAQITFQDHASGAYANFSASGGYITSATVNVSTTWVNTYGTELNKYSFQTYIHEVGHALGLAHAGFYNGSATYGVDNHYLNDSWQQSIMSYFDQSENTNVGASKAFVATPQLADILAVQALYGEAGDLRTGDTVYGYNSTAGGYLDDLAELTNVAFSILDDGGIDTFDFSDDFTNQLLKLGEETYSSVRGEVKNVAIARGTVIENAEAGSGNDLVIGNAVDNSLSGNDGNDMIYAGGGDDTLFGGDGDDRLVGEGGDDTMHGGDGNDILKGRTGNNTLNGDAGDDNLRGSDDGDDIMNGGADSDVLAGLSGDDRLDGGTGNDFLYGGRDNDIVIGGDGDDTVKGNRNNDLLSGDAGSDRLFGGGGNDSLDGGEGRDYLLGEGGDDSLDGGTGDDNLTGGTGSDIFVFQGIGYGYDRVFDFETGIDKVDLVEVGFSSFTQVSAIATNISAGLKLTFGYGDVLLLEGMTVDDLDEDDFWL